MKKSFVLVLAGLLILSCNNPEQGEDVKGTNDQKTLVDSLENQVMDGHDIGMRKYRDLKNAKVRAEQMIDSIAKLPPAERQAADTLKSRLESLVYDLVLAKDAMDLWMDGYNHDSATDNVEARIKYLTAEKIKVEKVRDAILSSLSRADSILKK
jgi:hypothetical protein